MFFLSFGLDFALVLLADVLAIFCFTETPFGGLLRLWKANPSKDIRRFGG